MLWVFIEIYWLLGWNIASFFRVKEGWRKKINLSLLLRLGNGSGYCRPFMADVLVGFRVACFQLDYWRAFIGTGTEFSPSTTVFPWQNRSARAPHSSPYTCCRYQKNKYMKFGKLQKVMLFQKSAIIGNDSNSVSSGCSVAQTLSLMSPRWPRLDSVSGCVWYVLRICVLVQVFVLLFVFFCPYHFTIALYSSSSLYYTCHRTNGRSQEKFKEVMLLRTSRIIGQKSTFACSLFASFMLQNLNFVPVCAEKKVERA
jgi:hypothetical protein